MGGKGSGRLTRDQQILRDARAVNVPMGTNNFGMGIELPNLSGVKEEALKTSDTDITGGGSGLTIKDEGSNLTTSATSIDFVGAGVTATNVGNDVTVTISGGGGGSALDVQSEGVSVDATVDTLDFSGEFTLVESPEDDIDISLNLGAIDHDSLLNFVANEHIDWTADQGATNIHANNYTDTNTTYTAGDGLDLTSTTFSADLKANGGIVIETGELAVDLSATSITGTLAIADTALVAGTNITLSTNTLNVDDAFIVNNADDTSTGKITAANFAVTGDNNTNDTEYVPMVLHGTDATPPTASTVPQGTIYIQYTA